MEMSLEYMRETVSAIAENGFSLDESVETVRNPAGDELYERFAFSLQRGDTEDLLLECLRYPAGTETYWLELRRMHRLRALPFQLDSWKHHSDRVEFRFYANDVGVALTIEMALTG